ncbi:MAG: MFS transporter [Actinomycetota bacterium]|nr:MFS transporter [Actinomycetota bacterium]
MSTHSSGTTKSKLMPYLAEFPNYLTLLMFSAFLLGPSTILIEIADSFNTTPADFSLVFTFFMIGLIAGQLTSNFYARFISRINLVSVVYAVLIVLAGIMYFNSNLYIYYLLYALSGYGLGIINIIANQYILSSPVRNKAKILTIASVFFPIGAILSPLLSLSVVDNRAGFKAIYLVYMGMFLLIFILYQVVTRNRAYHSNDIRRSPISLRQTLKHRGKNLFLAAACLAIMFYAIAETVLSTWAPTFFREARGLDPLNSGLLLTVFWIVLIIGRLILSQLTDRIKPLIIVLALTAAASIAMVGLLLSHTRAAIFASAVGTGLGFSAIFPLLVYVGSQSYPQAVNGLLPLLFISGTLGNALAPYMVSTVSKASMEWSLWLGYLFVLATLVLAMAMFVYSRKKLNSH